MESLITNEVPIFGTYLPANFVNPTKSNFDSITIPDILLNLGLIPAEKESEESKSKLTWFDLSNISSPLFDSDNTKDYSSIKGYDNFMNLLHRAVPNASQDFINWAKYTAKNESGFNSNAKNPKSTAYGYFQFVNGTWNIAGGGDKTNPLLLIKNAKNIYDRYMSAINNDGYIQHWMLRNGYSKRSVASAMHYVGILNIQSLAKNGKLSSSKGIDNKLLTNILKGKDYA